MAEQAQVSEKPCRFQDKGYCKFEEKCRFRHAQIICQQCSQIQCLKRHPTPCKFYFLKQNCKFKDKYMFSHENLNEKEEIKHIKEEIEAIKQKNKELENNIANLEQINKELEDSNKELKKWIEQSTSNCTLKLLRNLLMFKT